VLFDELQRGVLGQERALRFVSVAIHKHVLGKVSGNILLIGSSGTGKTTIMNNIQRLYDTVPGFENFRAVTILNANLLVDSDRTEFRPDRMFSAIEQRARVILGERPTLEALKETMERATVCVDEVDKMSTVIAGKPNPIGVVLQQGLLTLMEGERVLTTYAFDGEKPCTMEISPRMCSFAAAFEGSTTRSTPGQPGLRRRSTEAHRRRRVHSRPVSPPDFLKIKDLFEYGMVPQFMARFDKVVVLNDLNTAILKEILLGSYDSPLARTQRYFESLDIVLEIDDIAAAMIAEKASQENRTGARALRDVFSEIVNPIEFDPSRDAAPDPARGGRAVIRIDAARVRKILR
jgi:ATP-dependent Clp protease ATP-binding subunit ClpX